MGIAIVRDGVANFFDLLKRLTDFEGFDKIAGVVQPALALIRLQFGEDVIPEAVISFAEDLKSLKSIKNACFWIFNVDEAFKKPFSFKDFMSLGSLVNCAKRICFIGASIFMLGEYWDRIHKVAAPLGAFPWKLVLLLGGVAFSAIKGIIDLYENSANAAKLNQERQFYVKNADLTPQQISDKKNAIAAEVKTLQDSLVNAFAKDAISTYKETKKNEQQANEKKPAEELKNIQEAFAIEKEQFIHVKAKELLEKVNKVAVGEFAEIEKQKEMLRLLKNEKNRNQQEVLNDVETLLKMNAKQFTSYKFEVFKVREENLAMARKKSWRAIAYDISKVAVFTLILAKAPILSLVPTSFLDWTKKGIEGIGLISGLLGMRKFIFESYYKPKDEPGPNCVA